MYINFYQYFTLMLICTKKKWGGDRIALWYRSNVFFRSCFLWSGNKDICLLFNNEPFMIWKYSESIWTWYGNINIVQIN